MLSKDPTNRPGIKQCLDHDLFNEDIPIQNSQEEVCLVKIS